MPSAVPNYLTTLADGNVQAQFPGGVVIVADTDPNNHTAPHTVRWTKDTTSGAQVAEIGAYLEPGDSASSTFWDQQLPGTLRSTSVIQQCIATSSEVSVFATDAAGVGEYRSILEARGTSSFLSFGNPVSHPGQKSISDTGLLTFSASGTSAPTNVTPPGLVNNVRGGIATANSFVGAGVTVQAIFGGSFVQFIGYCPVAISGNVTFSYIIWYF